MAIPWISARLRYRLWRALDPDRNRPYVRLEIIDGAGHSDSEPGILDALIRATDSYRPFAPQ